MTDWRSYVGGIESAVSAAYVSMAADPSQPSPFRPGHSLATAAGYPDELLELLPAETVAAFCGVSDLSMWADLKPGQKVLDVGCGSGMDTVIASARVGPQGHVVGLDFCPAMLARARSSAQQAGLTNVTLQAGDAWSLPWIEGGFDAVLANGIFNLNERRTAIMREIFRALRPGGKAYLSELVRTSPPVGARELATEPTQRQRRGSGSQLPGHQVKVRSEAAPWSGRNREDFTNR